MASNTGSNKDAERSENASVPHKGGIKVVQSVTVNRPVTEIYQFWHNFENLPRFMNHLKSVTVQSPTRSHWVAKAPLGQTVEWDASVINDKENELIAWQSLDGSQISNAGSVHFEPSPDGHGTVVRVELSYDPPAGIVGAAIAKLLGEEPDKQVKDDLQRFKQVMEAGQTGLQCAIITICDRQIGRLSATGGISMAEEQQYGGVQTEMVSYPGNGGSMDGFLARPSEGGPHPGVIMVQEWWGLEPHIKDLAQRVAAEGYIVLIPDLYHGKAVAEPDEAGKAAMALNKDKAVQEIGQAIAYLRRRDDVEPKAVAMTGFCMGGFLTWKAAEQFSDQLACIAPFYPGGYNPSAADIAKISVPVLAVFGERDRGIPMSTVKSIESLLEQQGKTYNVAVYPAGHAFMNPDHGMGDADSAADAFATMIAWFKQYVG